MRVLHICTEKSWRGGENQIRLFVEGSRARGVVNFVAVPGDGRSYEKFVKVGATMPLVGKAEWSPISIFRLIQFCQKNQIQILNAHGSGGLGLALWVKKLLPHLKLVAHRRVDIPIAKDFFSRRKYLSPQIDQFVAISQKIKATMVQSGIPENKIVVVPSAIDPVVYAAIDSAAERQKILQQYNLSQDTILIGNASALVPTKGNQFFIFAIPEVLKKTTRPVHILLAGEGAQDEELKRFVREAGLQQRVSFLGHIDTVPNFLAALDIMAMPSMTEGLGTIILDAICAKTAVAASNIGGIPEMIIPNETGLLFPVGDVDAIVICLIRLIEDDAFRAKLIAQALKHVESNFSLENMIQGNLKIYKALMDKLPD